MRIEPMKNEPRLSIHGTLYTALLHIYPSEYRQEFAEEMQEVFSQAIADASRSGSFSLVSLLINELLDLPVSALRVHKQIRSTRTVSTPAANPDAPLELSWRELLVALAVFLLPAMMILANPVMTEATQSAGISAVLLFLAVMIAYPCRGPGARLSSIYKVVSVSGKLDWISDLVSIVLPQDMSPDDM